MKARILLVLAVVLGLCPLKGYCQGNTERGAVIGGLGGALAGAAIGKHNGKTGTGALIGGAAGLIAGSAIGNAQDQAQRREEAYYRSQVQQQQASRAVSVQDVVSMTQSGVDPNVVMTHIRRNGVTRRLEVSDVIALHQQGVSEPVINAMQNAPVAAYVPSPTYSRPVVVQERYYVAPAPVYYHSYPYHHHHHHGHGYQQGGTHVHVGIGR